MHKLSPHSTTYKNERPFKCPQCPYTARRRKYLQQHMLIHTCPFKCTICKYATARKINLRRHLLHHPSLADSSSGTASSTNDDHPFTIVKHEEPSECSLLQIEMNKVTRAQTEYNCSLCDFTTDRRQTLKVHERVHDKNSSVHMRQLRIHREYSVDAQGAHLRRTTVQMRQVQVFGIRKASLLMHMIVHFSNDSASLWFISKQAWLISFRTTVHVDFAVRINQIIICFKFYGVSIASTGFTWLLKTGTQTVWYLIRHLDVGWWLSSLVYSHCKYRQRVIPKFRAKMPITAAISDIYNLNAVKQCQTDVFIGSKRSSCFASMQSNVPQFLVTHGLDLDVVGVQMSDWSTDGSVLGELLRPANRTYDMIMNKLTVSVERVNKGLVFMPVLYRCILRQ